MKISYNITKDSIAGFFDGRSFVLSKEHPWFKRIVSAAKKDDKKVLKELLHAADAFKAVAKKVKEKVKEPSLVSFDGKNFLYNGKQINKAINDKLKAAIEDDMALDTLVAFVNKCFLNPSQIAVDEMFDFLSYKELPLTSDGDILAYKGVQVDFYSCTANRDPKFKLLKGKMRDNKIFNGVGETIEIERDFVDPNRRNECSHGLHVGSYDYAAGFGQKLIVVRVNPADCIAVPLDCSAQKMRVSRYEVVSEVE